MVNNSLREPMPAKGLGELGLTKGWLEVEHLVSARKKKGQLNSSLLHEGLFPDSIGSSATPISIRSKVRNDKSASVC